MSCLQRHNAVYERSGPYKEDHEVFVRRWTGVQGESKDYDSEF